MGDDSGVAPGRDSLTASRRRMLGALAAGGVALTGIGAGRSVRPVAAQQDNATPPGAAGTPTPFTGQVFEGSGFVGEAEDVPSGRAFVGVVVAEAEPGTETRDVRALLYGEPENGLLEWFAGETAGDRLDLVSEGGARLEAELADDGVTGTIELPDGTVHPFTTVPATGVAGLYTVAIFPDGRLEGTSERGVQLEGQLPLAEGQNDVYPLTLTLTPPDGEPLTLSLDFLNPPTADVRYARLIFLADGQVRGGAKKDAEGNFSARPIVMD